MEAISREYLFMGNYSGVKARELLPWRGFIHGVNCPEAVIQGKLLLKRNNDEITKAAI